MNIENLKEAISARTGTIGSAFLILAVVVMIWAALTMDLRLLAMAMMFQQLGFVRYIEKLRSPPEAQKHTHKASGADPIQTHQP